MSLGIAILLIVGGILAAALMNMGPSNLKSRFIRAGNLAGRTKGDIIAAVGQPSSISAAGGGKTVLQWIDNSMTGGYHIALLFNANNICEGVTHEHDGTGW